jgi:hypothetical protein
LNFADGTRGHRLCRTKQRKGEPGQDGVERTGFHFGGKLLTFGQFG